MKRRRHWDWEEAQDDRQMAVSTKQLLRSCRLNIAGEVAESGYRFKSSLQDNTI